MKLSKFLLFALIAVLAASAVTVLFYSFYYIFDVQKVKTDLEVVPQHIAGFNLDPDALHFGKLGAANCATRSLTITNSRNFPLRVESKVLGSIAPYIQMPDNGRVVQKGEQISYGFMACPKGAELGNYTGVVVVTFKRVI